MIQKIINSLVLLTSLVTAGSVFVHDTRLDKAAATAVTLPTTSSYGETGKVISFGDAHTHVERTSFSQAMGQLSVGTPSVQPRNDDKKHLLQNRVAKGHHPFDNYNLPMI